MQPNGNRFEVQVTGLDWVPNTDRTRWFLVLRVTTGSAERQLNRLLDACNKVVEGGGREGLYASASASASTSTTSEPEGRKGDVVQEGGFHVSIAWSLQAPDAEVRDRTRRAMEGTEWEAVLGLRVQLGEVKIKIGNVVGSVELGRAREKGRERKGLFGV